MTGSIARIVRGRLAADALPCILVLISLVVFLVGAGTAGASQEAPDWSLEATTGEKVSFHDQLAKGPVVISFWATWCKPCLKELPHLDRLAEQYADQISVLAVSTDAPKSVAKVAPFIQSKGFDNMTVLLDPGAELQNLLQVGGIVPFLILFDGQGREIYRHLGYKDGDEIELEHQIEAALKAATEGAVVATGKPAWAEAVTATDAFEYSYSSDTQKEIFENWLDVSYQLGGFRTGIMVNSQSPGEEGLRANEVKHRFFEFNTGSVGIRAGHFYGLFGRGLVFNAYEDRTVRVDTRLDGLAATYKQGRVSATAFSGTPVLRDLDIRALDVEYNYLGNLHVRENFGFGDFYVEQGGKTGYDFNPLNSDTDYGSALYANLNLYKGPFSASWEYSDYDKFEIVSRADGVTALNRPPALAREFTWTLLNRAPHTLNADDEKGRNLDLMYSGDSGLTFLASGADIERHDGATVYQLGYFSVEQERVGDFRLLGAFGYQDSDGLRQTMAGEVTWFAGESSSWTLQAEQQHVRLGESPGVNLGAYDEQWFKLEFETAPSWGVAAIVETNSKYDEQRAPGEEAGPFAAGQITYTLNRGGNLNLWFGQRQAGFLCSGGVCKFEPAFKGVEFFGVFRY